MQTDTPNFEITCLICQLAGSWKSNLLGVSWNIAMCFLWVTKLFRTMNDNCHENRPTLSWRSADVLRRFLKSILTDDANIPGSQQVHQQFWGSSVILDCLIAVWAAHATFSESQPCSKTKEGESDTINLWFQAQNPTAIFLIANYVQLV